MNNQMQKGGNGMNINNPMMIGGNGMNMNNPMMIGGNGMNMNYQMMMGCNGMNMNNKMMTGCNGMMNNPMMTGCFGGMNNPMMMGGNGGMNNPKKKGNNGDIDMDEQDKMMLTYMCWLLKNPNIVKSMGMKIEDIKSKIATLGYKYGKREAEKKEKEKNKNKNENEPKKEDNKAEDDVKEYTIKFKKGDKITDIKIDKEKMVAELLNQYFEKENVKNGTFTFKGRTLTTNDPESLTEAGLKNGDEITVT
jgi:hypothetical protein